MPEFSDLSLLPFCAGLTLLGLIASWAAFKRRGAVAGIRGIAWSLLPVSLYLTGLLELLWEVVRAASHWVLHLVFSPTVWAGVALFGVSVVLFVLSGVLRGRRETKAGQTKAGQTKAKQPKAVSGTAGELTATGTPPATVSRTQKAANKAAAKAEDNEFAEIEDILKRHGIN
ncbi:MAG TPA: hypothetical protein VEK80_09230 [Kribbellaceae bacterium]|nr:hypothetical protein [Kribbellaceae bacterium]